MKRSQIKFIILILFIAGAFAATRYFGLSEYLDEESLRAWINSYGVWGPVVYIAIYTLAPSLMVPGLPLTVVGGVLFGPVYGLIYVMIGATMGATLAFGVARLTGREWIEARIGTHGKRWQALDKEVEKKGWKIVAITRLIPLFPFNLLNYAFGLTRVKVSHYVIASFVFMIPGAAAYVVFSSSIFSLLEGRVSKELIIGAALIIIVSLIPIIYKKMRLPHPPGSRS